MQNNLKFNFFLKLKYFSVENSLFLLVYRNDCTSVQRKKIMFLVKTKSV